MLRPARSASEDLALVTKTCLAIRRIGGGVQQVDGQDQPVLVGILRGGISGQGGHGAGAKPAPLMAGVDQYAAQAQIAVVSEGVAFGVAGVQLEHAHQPGLVMNGVEAEAGRVVEDHDRAVIGILGGVLAQMRQFRDRFARAAVGAAEKWTFKPPSRGEAASQPYWVVRVPVDFNVGGKRRYGQWEAYVPGPRERVSWSRDEDRPGFSLDTLADGGVHMAGDTRGPKLLTPLGGEGS